MGVIVSSAVGSGLTNALSFGSLLNGIYKYTGLQALVSSATKEDGYIYKAVSGVSSKLKNLLNRYKKRVDNAENAANNSVPEMSTNKYLAEKDTTVDGDSIEKQNESKDYLNIMDREVKSVENGLKKEENELPVKSSVLNQRVNEEEGKEIINDGQVFQEKDDNLKKENEIPTENIKAGVESCDNKEEYENENENENENEIEEGVESSQDNILEELDSNKPLVNQLMNKSYSLFAKTYGHSRDSGLSKSMCTLRDAVNGLANEVKTNRELYKESYKDMKSGEKIKELISEIKKRIDESISLLKDEQSISKALSNLKGNIENEKEVSPKTYVQFYVELYNAMNEAGEQLEMGNLMNSLKEMFGKKLIGIKK